MDESRNAEESISCVEVILVIFTQPLTGDEDEEYGVTVSTFFSSGMTETFTVALLPDIQPQNVILLRLPRLCI